MMYANLWIRRERGTHSATVTRDGVRLGVIQRGKYHHSKWTATSNAGKEIGKYGTALEAAWALTGAK